MYCPNCGSALPDNARACSTCGVQFAPPIIGPAPGQQQPVAPVQPEGATQPITQQVPPIAPQPPVQSQPVQASAQPSATQPMPVTPPPQYQAQQPVSQPPQPTTPQPGQLIPKKKRTGLIVAVVVGAIVVLGAAAAAFFLLRPATPAAPKVEMPPAYAPMPVDTSFEVTATPGAETSSTTGTANADNTAAENVVVKFYETINSGDLAAVKKLVTAGTAATIDAGAFEGWSATTFEVTWSAVDANTASVYGRESRREFGSQDLGVKFTLSRQGGGWLIKTWTGVDEATVNGGTPQSGQGSGATALDETTARDTVTSLLKARQTGDSQTIRMLTTAKFQTDNGDVWLDGSDNTPYFTGFTIKSVTKKGATYVVTVSENWNSGTETGTYTVVNEGGTVLVNAWSSK